MASDGSRDWRTVDTSSAYAIIGDTFATDLLDVTHNPKRLDSAGWWVVTQTFEGEFTAYRFGRVTHELPETIPISPLAFKDQWQSSMDSQQYQGAVNSIKHHIATGWVYQANLCRVLKRELKEFVDPGFILQSLAQGNPAPFGGALFVPAVDDSPEVRITSFSPELFLSRNGNFLTSSPIKGTATKQIELQHKDTAENIMIVDLVRNDFSHIALPGSVQVPQLLRVEQHPGLVHLVSDVTCEISQDLSWQNILQAMSPAGSVSGAPKLSALKIIAELEPTSRDFYCGAFGWIDADAQTAQLAVGIRTFWQSTQEGRPFLKFGTGAGITWGSDPELEWKETELKAAKLFSLLEQLGNSQE